MQIIKNENNCFFIHVCNLIGFHDTRNTYKLAEFI